MSESQGNRDSQLSPEDKKRIDLLCDVFQQQWLRGQQPRIEEFVDQLPDIDRGILLRELIAVELELRRAADENPSVNEYLGRFPGQDRAVQEAFDHLARHVQDDVETIEPTESSGTPRQIGPYKLLQQIGEGGMGTVWMADQEKPVRRRVALKVIRADMGSKEIVARFEAERQALAMMDHQNIAKVLDAGMTNDGRPYFAMELVQGIPLTEYCDQNKLSLNERLELLVPVCNAVQHAHQKGIIHRDLKPSNVLVTLYDGKPVPKVIDFGLAKALQHQSRLTDKTLFTEFGQVVGTLQYMSPEQAEMNALNVDTRTDVYSLGVMLYELLTGSTPLEKETLKRNALLQIIHAIKETDPPRPSTRLSESGDAITGISEQRKITPAKLQQILRGELDWVVMRALEKDRTRRYETASSLGEDISRYLADEPVRARPPSTGYKISKFVKKYRGWVASSATMLLLLIAAVGGTSYGMLWAQNEKAVAQEALRKTRATIDKYVETVQSEEILKEERFRPLIKNLLKDALNHYESFVADHKHDDSTLVELANAIRQVGELSYQSGDQQKAIEAFEQELAIRERIANQNPSVIEFQEDLLESLVNMAQIFHFTGNFDEAKEYYREAHGLWFFKLSDPNNYPINELLETRILLYKGQGDLYSDTGDPKSALDEYQLALELEQLRVQENRNVAHYWGSLAASLNNIGTIHSNLGETEKAFEFTQQALEIQQDLAKQFPDVGGFRSSLANSLSNIGRIHAVTGKPDRAVEFFQKALAILQRLVQENPNSIEYTAACAHNHASLGSAYLEIGETVKSLESLQEALAIHQRLVQENPTVAEFRYEMGFDLGIIADLLHRAGNLSRSVELHQQSIDIQRQLVKENRTATVYASGLAASLDHIGFVFLEDGQPEKAIESYLESAAILETLVNGKSKNWVQDTIELGSTYVNIGSAFKETKEHRRSEEFYGKAVDTLSWHEKHDPSQPDARIAIRTAYTGRADLMEILGRYDEAVSDWEKVMKFDSSAAVWKRRDAAASKASQEKNATRTPNKN